MSSPLTLLFPAHALPAPLTLFLPRFPPYALTRLFFAMPSSPPTALITGATEGIGRATAFALGRAGYKVGVCARTEAKVQRVVEELRQEGIEAAGAAADVGQPGPAARASESIIEALGEVGVLVNNAGVLIGKPFEELTLDDWDTTMATNVRSLYLMTRAVLPAMRRRRQGSVVNVASLAGRNGFAGGTAYAASKHAVLGFSRSLMLEVRKENIRVIAICPGSVATSMLQDQPMLKSDPQRILKPEDVAATILHALSLPDRALVSELDIRPTNP
jgi:3-oxoacyl-[acyl-carrier protein] reductase